jgi:hypothetical protein
MVSATGWLTRILGTSPEPPGAALTPAPVVRSGPGLTALFESLDQRSHSVLDLGSASEASLAAYSRIARRVRFADLSSRPVSELDWSATLDEAGSAAVEPFDVILLWDTLGRLSAEERPRLIARLAQLAAPDARLHMVLEAPYRSRENGYAGREILEYPPRAKSSSYSNRYPWMNNVAIVANLAR